MARFDVYAYDSEAVPLLLDVQADLLGALNTRVVVPLVPVARAVQETLPRLKPVLNIADKNYILMTTDIGTLPCAALGQHIMNIEDPYRQEIIEAIDFLFQGF